MTEDNYVVLVATRLWGAEGELAIAKISVPTDKPVTITAVAKGSTSQRVQVLSDLFNGVVVDWQGQGTEIGKLTIVVPFSEVYVLSAHATRSQENQAHAWTANPVSVTPSSSSAIVSGIDCEGGCDVTIKW